MRIIYFFFCLTFYLELWIPVVWFTQGCYDELLCWPVHPLIKIWPVPAQCQNRSICCPLTRRLPNHQTRSIRECVTQSEADSVKLTEASWGRSSAFHPLHFPRGKIPETSIRHPSKTCLPWTPPYDVSHPAEIGTRMRNWSYSHCSLAVWENDLWFRVHCYADENIRTLTVNADRGL